MFGHQTAHTCELTNLLAVTTGAGIDHQENRIQLLTAIVMFQSAEHGTGNFVAGVRPDVDDLVVALAVRDDALTILLLNLSNLLISVLQFRLLLLRNDHVRNSNGDASLSGFGKAELFQFIQRRNRLRGPRDLITTPDDVAQLLLARGFVEKSKLLGPNLIEDDTACGSFDHSGFCVSVDCLLTEVGVLNPDAVVCVNASFCHRKFHFGCIGEEWEPLAILTRTARGLG